MHGKVGMHGRGCTWQRACMVGACVVGVCVAGGGVCSRRDDHCSGLYVTHPTGMHSCSVKCSGLDL